MSDKAAELGKALCDLWAILSNTDDFFPSDYLGLSEQERKAQENEVYAAVGNLFATVILKVLPPPGVQK